MRCEAIPMPGKVFTELVLDCMPSLSQEVSHQVENNPSQLSLQAEFPDAHVCWKPLQWYIMGIAVESSPLGRLDASASENALASTVRMMIALAACHVRGCVGFGS